MDILKSILNGYHDDNTENNEIETNRPNEVNEVSESILPIQLY